MQLSKEVFPNPLVEATLEKRFNSSSRTNFVGTKVGIESCIEHKENTVDDLYIKPFKKTMKIKAKIVSVERLLPKIYID